MRYQDREQGERRALVWTVAALCGALIFGSTAGAEMSEREIRRVVKQADRAVAKGNASRAVALYREVLGATDEGDARRARALYVVSVAELTRDSRSAEARSHLAELTRSYPRFPRLREATLLATLCDEADALDAARAAVAEANAELAASRAELAASRAELAGLSQEAAEDGVEEQASDDELTRVRAQLRQAQQELAAARAELQQKEEALQKFKDALVRRGSDGP